MYHITPVCLPDKKAYAAFYMPIKQLLKYLVNILPNPS